jgi:hypothetical protein
VALSSWVKCRVEISDFMSLSVAASLYPDQGILRYAECAYGYGRCPVRVVGRDLVGCGIAGRVLG